jgi:[acyl-carrier-protein] S-malonyltransferase
VLAFTFPGQGSQRPGMGEPWADHPSWELVEYASEVTGRDVAELLLRADQETLRRTANAQLATFVSSLVVLDAVERFGLEPIACAGHSLGEYTALVAAGAIGYEDGLRLVSERGEAMQDAADNAAGTMVVLVGLDADDVEAACQRAEGEVWVANYNAPGQVVIAGDPAAIETASVIAKSLGARRVLSIPVGGAFHTPFMASARDRLRKALQHVTFYDPEPVVFANVDARAHESAAEWSGLLSAQLCSPVRWQQTLGALAEAGARTFVELGPGGVLTGLARRALESSDVMAISVSTPDDLDRLAEAITGVEQFEAFSETHAGERFAMTERLVVSPGAGLFQPIPELVEATPGVRGAPRREGDEPAEPIRSPAEIKVGTLIGHVGDREIRSAFAGVLEGVLVLPGERVVAGQPVAWVRPSAEPRMPAGDAA